jgi:hypothetical protein
VQTFTGVHTGTPSWEYKKTYTEGLVIKHTRNEHYLQRLCYWSKIYAYIHPQIATYYDFSVDFPSLPQWTGSTLVAADVPGWTYDSGLGAIPWNGVNDAHAQALNLSVLRGPELITFPPTIRISNIYAWGGYRDCEFSHSVLSNVPGNHSLSGYYHLPAPFNVDIGVILYFLVADGTSSYGFPMSGR